MAEGVTCRPPLPGNWRPLEAARGPARGSQGMRLVSGEVERRTPRSAKQKRERRQLLLAIGKRIPGGRETLPLPTFPSRSRQGRSARHPAPFGQTRMSKRRWETMRRVWCWKGKTLHRHARQAQELHAIWYPFRDLPELHRFSVRHHNGMDPLSKSGDDGRGGYQAVPHLPPSCQTSAGTARDLASIP